MFKRSWKKIFKRDLVLPDNKIYYTPMEIQIVQYWYEKQIKEKQTNLLMQMYQMLNLIYQILCTEHKQFNNVEVISSPV